MKSLCIRRRWPTCSIASRKWFGRWPASEIDLSGADGRSTILALAEIYLRFGRYLEAASTIREGWVNQFAAKTALIPGAPLFDGTERVRAEDRAYNADPAYQ